MTACRSFLHARALPGRRADLVAAFQQRRILEECLETISGALDGELLLSNEDPDALCVSVLWSSVDAHLAWLASPVRAAQGPALAALVAHVEAPVLMSVASNVHTPSHEERRP